MRTKEGEGVKKSKNLEDVIYGSPLRRRGCVFCSGTSFEALFSFLGHLGSFISGALYLNRDLVCDRTASSFLLLPPAFFLSFPSGVTRKEKCAAEKGLYLGIYRFKPILCSVVVQSLLSLGLIPIQGFAKSLERPDDAFTELRSRESNHAI